MKSRIRTRYRIFSKIVLNNFQRERKTLSRHAYKSSKGVRKYPDREKIPDRKNIRQVFFHDTDKIIHSLAYSRYIDKTQVFYLFENDHITHRVLHVQFVSKIGRVIGRSLRLNEDLIEAISLGHDLGHVPYGHDGEEVLNELCKKNKIGYFCHNAQSVRFLMEIEQNGKGLNLSLQVLDGILAHNGEMLNKEYKPDYDKTLERFEEEYRKCFTKKDYSKKILPMTLEGCVVRISDVIAYIGRDIEDAIILELIKRKDIPPAVKRVLGATNDKIINNLALDLIKNSYGKNYLSFSKEIFKALNDLMEFNRNNIYFNPIIKTQSHKVKNMFEQLFEKYCQDLDKEIKSSSIYRYFLDDMDGDYRKNTDKERIVIDYIAGMTDDFFNNEYEKLFVPQSYGYSVKKSAMADNR
ncbi:MAG: deoxyguanosinetriphosphate triphosphohydrolase family protein [Candidatus Lokiarchaeia archaeon]